MNESVSVSIQALLDMRRLGEGLALPSTRIKSRQAGTYLSQHKGRGMEFEEHRLYQPGDDIRNIDWRVTARTGSPYTKIYREERERPVLFCVDCRRSMLFATRGVFKSVMAAKAAALLAWSSSHHGDRVGGLIFAEGLHQELRPQRGKAGVLKLIRALAGADQTPRAGAARLIMDAPMARLRRVARPGSLVCIISDFRGWNTQAESHLLQMARHSSVWLLFVYDALETALPPPGVYGITDGTRKAVLHTRSPAFQRDYRARFEQRRDHLETLCRRYAMSLISISTQADLHEVLANELVVRNAA